MGAGKSFDHWTTVGNSSIDKYFSRQSRAIRPFSKAFRYIRSPYNKPLSIVIQLEPNEKQNDETIWYINYGKDRQGSIITNEHEVGAPYVNFGSALMNTFTQSKDAILILDGYMMALMHDINSFFYLFDTHTRNSFGMLLDIHAYTGTAAKNATLVPGRN